MRTATTRAATLALVFLAAFTDPCAADHIPTHFDNPNLVAEAKLWLTSRAHLVESWGRHAAIRAAVVAQNKQAISAEKIQATDLAWRTGQQSVHSLVDTLLRNECADALRGAMGAEPPDNYREAFVTDAKGAIVCMTERTSDYWQADETKWTAAYNNGLGALFIGPVQIDESVGLPLVQLAVPIFDGDEAVGVLIVGKIVRNLSVGQKLERRPAVD